MAAEQHDQARSRQRWTLGVVCVGTFMLLLDITVVNVALPAIQRSLHASFSDLQWVVDAYSLTLAAFLLTAGSLSDLLGRQRVFLLGLVLFTVSSALCGLAGDPTLLNVARGLQGTGGAMVFATSLALLAQEFHGRERGTAFGIWGATIGGAVAVGPLVGGLLTDGIGWQSIFYVNVPIGLLAVFIAVSRVPNIRGKPGRIDWGGLVTFSGSLLLLVLALVRGNDDGWTSTTIIAMLAASVLLMIAFLVIERAQSDPMLDLSLFRKPTFAGASIVAFSLSASMFALFLYLTLWLQGTLELSPLDAGLRFLPLTLISFFAAPIAGRLSARVPVRILLSVGMALVGVALLLMHGLTAGSSWTALLLGFLISGAGIGMVNPSLASTAVGVVEAERTGMGSGINNTFRQIGVATGIAGLGAVYAHEIRAHVSAGLAGTPGAAHAHQLASAVVEGATRQAAGSLPAGAARDHFVNVAATSVSGALNELFLIGAGVALAGSLMAALLVRSSDFVSTTQAAPAAA